MEERFWFFTERRCHSRNNRITWYHWRKTRRELETRKRRLVLENSELAMEIKINLCFMMLVKTTIRRVSSSKIWVRNMVHLSIDTSHATSATFERWLFCIPQSHVWGFIPEMAQMTQWPTILNTAWICIIMVPETRIRGVDLSNQAARLTMIPMTDKITWWAHRIRNTQSQPHLSTRRP